MLLKNSVLTLMFCVLFTGCLSTLKDAVKQTNTSGSESLPQDSVLQIIQKESDLVVGYSIHNLAWVHIPIEYFLVSFRGNTCKAYHYVINRVAINQQKRFTIDTFPVTARQ